MYMGLTQFLVYAEPSIINMRVATHCRICLSLSFSLPYLFLHSIIQVGFSTSFYSIFLSLWCFGGVLRCFLGKKRKCGSLLRKDV